MAEIVGSRLRQLIADRGTNQSELARAMGISQPSVGRLISGETRETGKLLELARALRTTPDYIVGFTDDADALPASGSQLSSEEREVLACLNSINASDRAAVIQVVRAMARAAGNATHRVPGTLAPGDT